MSDDDRKAKGARLGALLRTIDPTEYCWGPSPNSSHAWCGGTLVWTNASGEWRSLCPRCGASGLAATGERIALARNAASSYEPSVVAYYFREGKHGGIEVYPPASCDEKSGPPGVLFWSGLDDFAEPLPFAGALQGDRFKALAAFLGATP